MALVKHPLVKAVGFTGSHNGGRALMDVAAARPEPIPVFAEMSSTNPVFILPGALRENGDDHRQRNCMHPSPWVRASSAPTRDWYSCPRRR